MAAAGSPGGSSRAGSRHRSIAFMDAGGNTRGGDPRTRQGDPGPVAWQGDPGPAAEFAAWPKAELHLHLDGSLLIGTALELARTRGVDAPADHAGMRAALVAPEWSSSQADLLRAFTLPIALLQDAEALQRVTRELVETKAADGVRYVEIR